MVTRNDICTEALTWLNTPWQHGQGLKGVGCDCVHLPLRVAQTLGLIDAAYTPQPYSQQWHLHKRRDQDEMLLTILRDFPLRDVPKDQRQPGDLLVFRWLPHQPCAHMGILLPGERVIHALCGESINRVIVQRLHGWRLRQVAYVYAFTVLEDR
jgi:NlpC/P60 family putative phage cell wall peptidase